jgi:hypothetical protein
MVRGERKGSHHIYRSRGGRTWKAHVFYWLNLRLVSPSKYLCETVFSRYAAPKTK